MIKLYHAGYEEIKKPDVHYGRKNADFGQGFYTTDNLDFACGWVREKPGADIIINSYELDEKDLKVKKLERDSSWFNYIFSNRRVKPDEYAEYDIIVGPIAGDTIYDTFGIITSGFLTDEEAMRLLMVGDSFDQIVLKTQRAADSLKFVSSAILSKERIAELRKQYEIDNHKYQEAFALVMRELDK
nr:DUF3990 domain-containing protein [uncultured Butyrivibrio sp.]